MTARWAERLATAALVVAAVLISYCNCRTHRTFAAAAAAEAERAIQSGVVTIRPLPCAGPDGQNGTCMFNVVCKRQNGLVVGTCIDRFMFGACCQLQPSVGTVAAVINQELGSVTSQLAAAVTSPAAGRPTQESPAVEVKLTTEAAATTSTTKATPKTTAKRTTTRKPKTTAKPTTRRTTTKKPTTRKPTTRKPKPKPTTTAKKTTTKKTTTTTTTKKTTKHWDYRKHCGVVPLASRRSIRQLSSPAHDNQLTAALLSSAERRRHGSRIVGGKAAYFAAWPWQVLIKEATFLGLFTKNKCGGVLLNTKYVLTAAHCQPGFMATLIAVFGELDVSAAYEPKDSYQRNVKRILVHKQFRPQTFSNDLALLELDRPVVYDEHVVPICLPERTDRFEGQLATVTGWGRLTSGGDVPSKLMEVDVRIITNEQCQAWFDESDHSKTIEKGFICAGYKEGVKDSCEGDSGGPLMVQREDGRWVLVGTVSHGIKCAWPNLPGIYMRISHYRDWLDEKMRS